MIYFDPPYSDQLKYLMSTWLHQTAGKVDLEVREKHPHCCKQFENQIVFHENYYFLKDIQRGDYRIR